MPKYVGQSNAYDIPNNVIYLGDLLYAWDVGDDLTGWTLTGTTLPTIAADGRMKLYDNNAAANSFSQAKIAIPNTLGQLYCIFRCKFTRMLDDIQTDDRCFVAQIAGSSVNEQGIHLKVNMGLGTRYVWNNNAYLGNENATTFGLPVAGQEYDLSIILTPQKSIMIINGVQISEILNSKRGTAPLPATPYKDFLSANKVINLFVRHQLNEVSHYRVRDIRVSRLVGIS